MMFSFCIANLDWHDHFSESAMFYQPLVLKYGFSNDYIIIRVVEQIQKTMGERAFNAFDDNLNLLCSSLAPGLPDV